MGLVVQEAVQPSTNTAIVIKLFITITKPVMLFESRMVYDCVDSLWSIMAGVGQASLSDYFEVGSLLTCTSLADCNASNCVSHISQECFLSPC